MIKVFQATTSPGKNRWSLTLSNMQLIMRADESDRERCVRLVSKLNQRMASRGVNLTFFIE